MKMKHDYFFINWFIVSRRWLCTYDQYDEFQAILYSKKDVITWFVLRSTICPFLRPYYNPYLMGLLHEDYPYWNHNSSIII